MKYIKIIVEMNGVGMIIPVMFPNMVVHKLMAEKMVELCKIHWPKATAIKIESAGDFSPGFDCEVSGKSESLNLESSFVDKLHIRHNDSMNIIPL